MTNDVDQEEGLREREIKKQLNNPSELHDNDEKNVRDVTEPRSTGGKFNRWYMALMVMFMSLCGITYAKYYYSFAIIDEKHYKSVFYGWRTLYGDNHMFSTTWKYVRPNKYDRNNDADKYTQLVKLAQDEQLLFTGHPEHFPRGQNAYNTHSGVDFNDDFLAYRKKFCDTCDSPLTSDQISGVAQISDKKMNFWAGKRNVDISKIYSTAPKMIKTFMVAFTVFLNRLYSGYYKKNGGLVDKDCPDELAKDLSKLASIAQLDVSTKYVKTVPAKFGKAKANAFELFGYSRLFYLFYLHTLNAEIDVYNGLKDQLREGSSKEREEVSKKIALIKKNKNKRMKTVATCFTEIMSGIFKYDFGSAEYNSFHKFMLYIYGNKETTFKSQKENIDNLLNELNSVVEVPKEQI